ncbi:hypothetical protein PB2503_06252 [Parvularcula bermudensis HTCC2503]|uniref:O-antigen ligase-related domain-containing protein n=1 Tax=Parvularcula bermudensis (strain ATCC BAA-594 / HTCC2503 / KCTC 12087) TaxID=314260 RepID=E0THM0_PARBH|nr:O-antigen ligase family protein [Parvularcula bermudensis]ADM09316.1 hypothetical protein PB2503_06252 [Parvularcula bermudensis HTCC2503]
MLPIRASLSALFFLVLIGASLLVGADAAVPKLALSSGLLLIGGVIVGRGPFQMSPRLLAFGGAGGLAIVLSQGGGGHLVGALPDLFALCAAAALVLGFASLGAETRRLRNQALNGIGWSLLLVILIGVFGYLIDPGRVLGAEKSFHLSRLTGTYLSANSAATLYGMAACLAVAGLGRALSSDQPWPERMARAGPLPYLLLLAAVSALMMTGSRAGIVASTVGVVATLVGLRRRFPWRATSGVMLGALLFGSLIAALLGGDSAPDRVVGLGATDSGRGLLWSACLQAIREAPLFGHGMGAFQTALSPHITLETAPLLSQQGAAHQWLLQWLVQAGIVGTLGGVAVLLTGIVAGLAGLRDQPAPTASAAALGASTVLLLHGLVDYGAEIPANLWWWAAILGLGAGAARRPATPKAPLGDSGA